MTMNKACFQNYVAFSFNVKTLKMNRPFPPHPWWVIMEHKNSGKRTIGSLIFHIDPAGSVVVMGRVYSQQ